MILNLINNQITYLKDDFYIDSRITGRNQIQDDDIFFADELVIQTAHKPGASRVNQVETISKFQKCSKEIIGQLIIQSNQRFVECNMLFLMVQKLVILLFMLLKQININ